MRTKTSLSGIKPTGFPHLGNLLGMVEPAIELQKTHEAFYFIANYHALTTLRDAASLQQDTHVLAATFLALGFNADRGALFKQSNIPEIPELFWLLACTVSLGDLFRSHAFKVAKEKNEEGQLNLGVFSYPVLMAADILAYHSDVVPVGKDQVQHVEIARAIAKRFNHHFGNVLKEPQELVRSDVAVVPGIDGQKMSKSYNNGIEPLRPSAHVKKQVMAIVTDSKELSDVKDPDTCNVVALYKLLATKEEVRELEKKYRAGGYGYGHAKLALLEKIENKYSEPRKKFEDLMKDPSQIEKILAEGAQKARKRASALLLEARKACGV